LRQWHKRLQFELQRTVSGGGMGCGISSSRL